MSDAGFAFPAIPVELRPLFIRVADLLREELREPGRRADRSEVLLLNQIRHAFEAASKRCGGSVMPYSDFALYANEDTLGPDDKPTVYTICACGRGYAFGHRATAEELFAFLSDHDWKRPDAPH